MPTEHRDGIAFVSETCQARHLLTLPTVTVTADDGLLQERLVHR